MPNMHGVTLAAAVLAQLIFLGGCGGSGDADSGESDRAEAQATAAPTLTRQPASVTVQGGSSASFVVRASGTPPLTYRWTRNGKTIPGATKATLTLSAASVIDDGQRFRVEVRNARGSVTSRAAVLRVTSLDATGARCLDPDAKPGKRVEFTFFNDTLDLDGSVASHVVISIRTTVGQVVNFRGHKAQETRIETLSGGPDSFDYGRHTAPAEYTFYGYSQATNGGRSGYSYDPPVVFRLGAMRPGDSDTLVSTMVSFDAHGNVVRRAAESLMYQFRGVEKLKIAAGTFDACVVDYHPITPPGQADYRIWRLVGHGHMLKQTFAPRAYDGGSHLEVTSITINGKKP